MLTQEVWKSMLKKYFSVLALFIFFFFLSIHLQLLSENRSLEGPLV